MITLDKIKEIETFNTREERHLKLLINMIKDTHEPEIRLEILRKLNIEFHVDIIVFMANEDKDKSIRLHAIRMINPETNSVDLAKIAIEEDDEEFCLIALEQMETNPHPSFILTVAEKAKHYIVRLTAIAMLP